MSVVNARQFLEILANNAEVRDQLYIAAPADSLELLSFALQKGYAFSEVDLLTALADFPDQALVDQLNVILEA